MRLDRKTFYTYARRAPFGGRLSTRQVDGLECLLREWETGAYGTDPRYLAHCLAEVFHETGGRMVPVREGFAASDAAARKCVARRRYGRPDPVTGEVYYGRGPIQLTWAENYRKLGTALGIDLFGKPDLALDPAIGAKIAFVGMTRGLFARDDAGPHTLARYFGAVDDPVGARRIVNGSDKGRLIATYHEQFLGAVTAADRATALPTDVSARAARPDDVNPAESRSFITMGTSALAGLGGVGAFGNISNPYALAAVALIATAVAVGCWLVLSGRIEIKRSHAL
jgi:predicted chitinase